MDLKKHTLLWVGISLILISLVLLGLSFIPGWTAQSNPAIIFLSMAGVFVFLLFAAPPKWWWKGWLFIPIVGFFTFGIVFLFNALTGDWGAWAYAWMLCIAGLSAGMSLAVRATIRNRLLYDMGIWVAAGGIVLFAVFGAIANGPFMRAFALVLLGAVGLLIVVWVKKGINWLDWDSLSPIDTSEKETAAAGPSEQQPLVEPLSKREIEVLQWIDQGLSNAEIAGRMVVAQSTVKTHINNIFSKLGVQSRTQAIHRAKELGLL